MSHTAIRKAVEDGRLRDYEVPHRTHRMLILEEAVRDWYATRREGNNNRFGELPGEDGSGELFAEADLDDGCGGKNLLPTPERWGEEKTKQEALLAKERRLQAELQRQELEESLNRAEDVQAVWADIVIRVKQRISAIPAKAAALMARESDAGVCQKVLDDLMSEALSELAEYDEYQPKILQARKRRGK